MLATVEHEQRPFIFELRHQRIEVRLPRQFGNSQQPIDGWQQHALACNRAEVDVMSSVGEVGFDLRDQPVDQGGLSDAGGSYDGHRARQVQLVSEGRNFPIPADECRGSE